MHRRREAAEEMAAKLFQAEKAINDAITAAAQLVAFMPQACGQAGVTAAYGQAAVTEAVAAINALSEARERIGASHTKLSAIQRQVGLRTMALGGQEKPPPEALATGLRAVGGEQAA